MPFFNKKSQFHKNKREAKKQQILGKILKIFENQSWRMNEWMNELFIYIFSMNTIIMRYNLAMSRKLILLKGMHSYYDYKSGSI